VTCGWRKLSNEELHYLYFSPNITQVIKLRNMRLAGHVARKEEKIPTEFSWKNLKQRDHLAKIGD
jgi:hypothetical protein